MKAIILALFLTGCASQQQMQNIQQTAYTTSNVMGQAAMVVYSIKSMTH